MPFRSLTLWLVLMLVLGDLALAASHPFQYLPKKFRPISNDSWVSKFPVFFRSHQTPDVFVLGSSLPMAGFSLTDAGLQDPDQEQKNEKLRTTLRCDNFSNLLGQRFGGRANIAVANLSCAGCMISDVYHLMQKAVDNDVAPKSVILGIAPRDFSDNWIPPVGQTPLWQVVDEWSIGSLLTANDRPLSERLMAVGKEGSELLRMRKDLKNCLSLMFDTAVRKPDDFAASWRPFTFKPQNNGGAACVMPLQQEDEAEIIAKDLKVYAARYSPANQTRFASEIDCLNKLIALCHEKHIALTVVDMPLTPANLALLPVDTATAYQRLIANLVSDSRVKFIQCNRPDLFLQSDFSDSAHLNARGADKFQKFVVAALSPADLNNASAPVKVVHVVR